MSAVDFTDIRIIFLSFLIAIIISSALAVYFAHYQPHIPRVKMSTKLSDKVLKLVTETPSVTQLLEKDHTKAPIAAAKELFGHENITLGDSNKSSPTASGTSSPNGNLHYVEATDDELEKTRKCGNWGNSQPSETFLRMYHAALLTLDHDPLVGVVSPSLMGNNGVITLTVIGVVWDVCRHMVIFSMPDVH
jgi:hypothetical protein